jgi:integrase
MYYARVAIPLDLRSHFPSRKAGKFTAEVWQSLRTRDPKEAAVKGKAVVATWDAKFAELRRRTQPTEADLRDAIHRRYGELIEADEKFRQETYTQDELDKVWSHLESEFGGIYEVDAFRLLESIRDEFENDKRDRTARLAKLKAEAPRGETKTIGPVVGEVVEARRWLLEKSSGEYRKLAHGLQRAEIEALNRAAERDRGDFSGTPADPIVLPPDHLHGKKHAAPGETISELYEIFDAERKESVSADTRVQSKIIIRLFAEFVGETAHISTVTRTAVRNFKQALGSYPINANKVKAFAGMSFRKIVESNATLKRPTLSTKTINRYLSAVAIFSKWLATNDYIPDDVARGMLLSVDKKKRKRYPFSDDQLKLIFKSPLFHKCAGDDQEHLPGDVEIRDWRYWLPLIALYSGARLGELAQLLTADVKQIHDSWVFHITREGSDRKRTKTEGSQRVVPVHPELIRLGFLEYHAKVAKRGEVNLFPEIEPDARGFLSGKPSRFFNDYLRAIGAKEDKRVAFHSFRHSAADAFRRGGYADEQFGPLLGHGKATTTGRYGIMPQGILEQRVAMVEAIAYPAIE